MAQTAAASLRGPARRLPRTIVARELAVTVARPRALAIKVALPLLLAVALLAGHAPTFWAGMLLTVITVMIGAVGTAVSMSRARETGFMTRLAATPGSRARLVLGWVLAAAAVDAVQLLPVVAAAAIAGGASPADVVRLLLVVGATLVVTNTLGCLLTLGAAGAAEVLLDAVVVLAPLLYLGGLFTGVPADGWRSVAGLLDPFSHLHAAYIAVLGGTPSYGAVTDVVASVLAALLGCGVLALASRRVLEREA
ncbi:MAG: ABC transporter permease [Candidatus Dormibacteria bacterium]